MSAPRALGFGRWEGVRSWGAGCSTALLMIACGPRGQRFRQNRDWGHEHRTQAARVVSNPRASVFLEGYVEALKHGLAGVLTKGRRDAPCYARVKRVDWRCAYPSSQPGKAMPSRDRTPNGRPLGRRPGAASGRGPPSQAQCQAGAEAQNTARSWRSDKALRVARPRSLRQRARAPHE